MPTPVFMDSLLPGPSAVRRPSHKALWSALLLLIVVALALLMSLAIKHRTREMQLRADEAAAMASGELETLLASDLAQVLTLLEHSQREAAWSDRATAVLARHPEIARVERLDEQRHLLSAADNPGDPHLFAIRARDEFRAETELACTNAQRHGGPAYADAYFVPTGEGLGVTVLELCVPDGGGTPGDGYTIAIYRLSSLLNLLSVQTLKPGYDVALSAADGARVAHGRSQSGRGMFRATNLVSLPGTVMQLQIDSSERRPGLMPDPIIALVVALSAALLGVLVALARDMNLRARAESDLGEALAFRKAMEDSVVTGLRARDMSGHTTYVNPAFCAMVGFETHELLGVDPPPYWPPENIAHFEERKATRFATEASAGQSDALATQFIRKNGERFPVVIYEAPLLNNGGQQRGWMSSVLDITDQRRFEELARQQQERLQATARLATAGEMASLLSHELNQPLSAIAAYATGSLNMVDSMAQVAWPDLEFIAQMRQALVRVAEQAERAGRVIKSVHSFVRRREGSREAVTITQLLETVKPLISMQAQASRTRVHIDVPAPSPIVVCDSAMVEQVLLNLTRNGIQAMATLPPELPRILTIRVRADSPRWVKVWVEDGGLGVDPDVAAKLFTPFYTTRAEGMGLGLSVCRTIIEQHGGTLTFTNLRGERGAIDVIVGASFSFTLPTRTEGTRT